MNDRRYIIWLTITLTVMLILPLAVARLASENSGMVLCMMLFFIVNPLYAAILGYQSGKEIHKMWTLPLVSSITFLSGTWIFFDIKEPWFIIYAGIYLIIGYVAMIIRRYALNETNRQ